MKFILPFFILLASCSHYATKTQESSLISVQFYDKNGFTETVSTQERLDHLKDVDFLSAQPYEKVLRVFSKGKDGKAHALLTSYHKNGEPAQYLEVLDGRAHGIYKEWYPNGQRKIEVNVIEGLADFSEPAIKSWLFDGLATAYDEKGQLQAKIPYAKGELSGISYFYFPSGAIEKEVPYLKGKIEGLAQIYNEKGEVVESQLYREGLEEGEHIASLFREEFSKGKLINATYFSPEKELLCSVQDGNGKQVLYKNGKVKKTRTIQEGIPQGTVEKFSEEGIKLSSYQINKEGVKEGEETLYFPNGNKKMSLFWKDDAIEGVVRTWYENGAKQSEKEMSENKKQGLCFSWYEKGDLMLMEEYNNGKLIKGLYYKQGDKEPVSKVENGKGVASLYNEKGRFLKKVNYVDGKPELGDY